MTIDVTVNGGGIQLAIAIATAIATIAAWGSVFLQRRQQKRDAEQARTHPAIKSSSTSSTAPGA